MGVPETILRRTLGLGPRRQLRTMVGPSGKSRGSSIPGESWVLTPPPYLTEARAVRRCPIERAARELLHGPSPLASPKLGVLNSELPQGAACVSPAARLASSAAGRRPCA